MKFQFGSWEKNDRVPERHSALEGVTSLLRRHENDQIFWDSVFAGCQYRWVVGLDGLDLDREEIYWLRQAVKERGLPLLRRRKYELIQLLLGWERRQSARVTMLGSPRYCQIAEEHEPHRFEYRRTVDGITSNHSYSCDGRVVDELA